MRYDAGMSRSLVSIVIPCFNAQAFVGEAIASALAQTWPAVEVVVVDDGSTDESLRVIESFGSRIRWTSTPNRGGSAARNLGLEMASGELIQFLDADDLLRREKLERQLPVVRESPDALVFSDGTWVGGDGEAPNSHHLRTDSCEDPVQFMLRAGLHTAAAIHRREWLTRIGGFRVDLPCAQERDLYLRLAASGRRFQRLAEPLYVMRPVPGSVSWDHARVIEQRLSIVDAVVALLEARDALTEERAQACAAFLANGARYFYRHRTPEVARRFMAAARRCHPSGGLAGAYSDPARWLLRLVGPRWTEQLVSMRRKHLR